GVRLSLEHEDKTDANTVALVRNIVELAILKHGDPERAHDVAISSEVKLKQILGGHYQRILRKLGKDAAAEFKVLAASKQWVMTDFEQRDFFDMFMVEGLGYEYWRTTAAMRGIGKGLCFCNTGSSWPEYGGADRLGSLIISYDERIDRAPFST